MEEDSMDTLAFRVDAPLLTEADAEARRLGHLFLAPEHLLIAVATNGRGASRSFFERHGLTAATLRDSVVAELGPLPSTAEDGPRRIALRSVVALGHAVSLGRRRGGVSAAYTPDDLLLALLDDDVAPHAAVGAVLARAGLTPAAARAEVAELASGERAT
jgi:ATP-dependent Clp protease ATP-binding subunit ClpA